MKTTLAACAAVITIAGGLALAGPARASTPPGPSATSIAPDAQAPGNPQYDVWCLTNRAVTCISFDPYQAVEAVSAAIVGAYTLWLWHRQATASNGDAKGEDENVEDGAGNTDDAGLCLADTGGAAYDTTCGANGTTWILVPHGGGYYMESQWELNRGWSGAVLSASLISYGYLFLDPAGDTAEWQTWSWE